MQVPRHLWAFLLLTFSVWGSYAQGLFEPNLGQWEGAFSHRLRMNTGTAFLERDGIRFHFRQSDLHHHHKEAPAVEERLAFQLQFVGGQSSDNITESKVTTPHHYLQGNDPSRWRTDVYPGRGVRMQQLYPGIDVEFTTEDQALKFNFHLQAGADPERIRYRYQGVESVQIKGGKLLIHTAFGTLEEWIPKVYQPHQPQREVRCQYTLADDGTIGLKLGSYDRRFPLIIDPVLVFSSFSGSNADNWGFSATYDNQGHVYGGGIAFGMGYPTTLGVYQENYGGGVIDVAITKFNADGTQALYATYLGGSGNEQPHSLVVDQQGNLIVLGITGSNNFPMHPQAYQSAFQGGTNYSQGGYGFNGGTDLFIAKLNANGTQLLGSTFFGGSLNDGINDQFAVNYADEFRGEVVVDDQNNIYIASVTQSANVNMPNGFQPAMAGWQDALIASFPPNLQGIRWGTYYGGPVADNANALELGTDGSVYIVGGTRSNTLPMSATAIQPTLNGNSDGYILRLSSGNGSFLNATYIGSNAVDQVYLVDIDRFGFVYVFGQTFGVMPISAGVFSQSPGGQFLQKLSSDLSQLRWSTVIGNGQVPNMSPTAFLVDDCLNIYLSGWGGVTNTVNLGLMNNMPLSADALQDSTDGSEFYFMVLEEDARALQFATYYGGRANEHVDAGTSRFSPEGTIYQAVCAGCSNQTFPTTPGVYGPTNNSNNCNLGVIKIDFESSITAAASIDLSVAPDTICDTLLLHFANNSVNANRYLWDFGNGSQSNLDEPTARFDRLGTYAVTLVAFDTLCGTSDTARLSFTHSRGSKPQARFAHNAVSCNPNKPVQFSNTSQGAQAFVWNFDDGTTSTDAFPLHRFPSFGQYEVRLIAIDTICSSSDTTQATLVFDEVDFNPSLSLTQASCEEPLSRLEIGNVSDSVQVNWVLGTGDSIAGGRVLNYRFPGEGFYRLQLRIQDTVCDDAFVLDTLMRVEERIDRLFIPNVFTPNGDGRNEVFTIAGDECYADSRFLIFNRWGELIFETRKPFEEFWDANQAVSTAQDGVYQWVLIHRNGRIYGQVTVLR